MNSTIWHDQIKLIVNVQLCILINDKEKVMKNCYRQAHRQTENSVLLALIGSSDTFCIQIEIWKSAKNNPRSI